MPLTRDSAERLLASGSFFWIDLHQPTEEDFSVLRDVFRFHPLALEDSEHLGSGRSSRIMTTSRTRRRRPSVRGSMFSDSGLTLVFARTLKRTGEA